MKILKWTLLGAAAFNMSCSGIFENSDNLKSSLNSSEANLAEIFMSSLSGPRSTWNHVFSTSSLESEQDLPPLESTLTSSYDEKTDTWQVTEAWDGELSGMAQWVVGRAKNGKLKLNKPAPGKIRGKVKDGTPVRYIVTAYKLDGAYTSQKDLYKEIWAIGSESTLLFRKTTILQRTNDGKKQKIVRRRYFRRDSTHSLLDGESDQFLGLK